MQLRRLDLFVQRLIRPILRFAFAETVTVLAFGGAVAVGLTAWFFLNSVIYWVIRSRLLYGAMSFLVRKSGQSLLRVSYALVLIIAAMTLYPVTTVGMHLAYQSGRFGEPPGNRYVWLYIGQEKSIIVEYGVEVTPLGAGFSVFARFTDGDYSLRRAWYGRPSNPKSVTQNIAGYLSGRDDNASPAFYFAPNHGAISRQQSLYLDFTRGSDKTLFNDGLIVANDESFSEGQACMKGNVGGICTLLRDIRSQSDK